jgi:hypothetical protein
MKTVFNEVILLGKKPALFSEFRIDRATVPKGYFAYDVRHDDATWTYPVEIAKFVLVNHMGTLITRDRLYMPKEHGLCVDKDAINYAAGDCRSMKDFMAMYPPKLKPPKSHER